MHCFKKMSLLLLCALLLVGCARTATFDSQEAKSQEEILLKVNNYNGLITLYRSWLKEKDDPATRMKLARNYYLSGDYKSSLQTLQPLLNNPDIPRYLLQAQNLIALGEYLRAVRVTEKIMQREPQHAEAWNLRGVALALNGQLTEAQKSLQRARSLFIADDIALNNLAMLAMLDGRYQDAVNLLLPQYLRGRKHDRLMRNLVLALVKVGDKRYARDIIREENLSPQPEALINALAQIPPPSGRGFSS